MSSSLKRMHNYPAQAEVQRQSGHVYVKGPDGKWHPRGRIKMARFRQRPLEDSERVYHINGNPSDDHPDNLVAIRFSGTIYRIPKSRPVYIPQIARVLKYEQPNGKETSKKNGRRSPAQALS